MDGILSPFPSRKPYIQIAVGAGTEMVSYIADLVGLLSRFLDRTGGIYDGRLYSFFSSEAKAQQ